MKALWIAGKATVHEIRAGLLPDRPLAYTTVMTVMDRLARKGIVQRVKRGRAHLYHPVVSEGIICEFALKQLVDTFFRGSQDELQNHLKENGATAHAVTSAGHARINAPKMREVRADAESRPDVGIDTSLL